MQVNYPDTINKLSHITPMTNTLSVPEPERQFPKFPTETSTFFLYKLKTSYLLIHLIFCIVRVFNI